jgi:hypothetical protein
VDGDEADRHADADGARVRRRQAMPAGDEDEQHRQRDPAGDSRGVDLRREVAALAGVVERVRHVRGDEHEGGTAERGAGRPAHG